MFLEAIVVIFVLNMSIFMLIDARVLGIVRLLLLLPPLLLLPQLLQSVILLLLCIYIVFKFILLLLHLLILLPLLQVLLPLVLCNTNTTGTTIINKNKNHTDSTVDSMNADSNS